MAYVQNSGTQAELGWIKARLMAARNAVQRHVAQRAAYRATLRELQALSNRELADLGIHRSEISRVAQDAMKNA